MTIRFAQQSHLHLSATKAPDTFVIGFESDDFVIMAAGKEFLRVAPSGETRVRGEHVATDATLHAIFKNSPASKQTSRSNQPMMGFASAGKPVLQVDGVTGKVIVKDGSIEPTPSAIYAAFREWISEIYDAHVQQQSLEAARESLVAARESEKSP